MTSAGLERLDPRRLSHPDARHPSRYPRRASIAPRKGGRQAARLKASWSSSLPCPRRA